METKSILAFGASYSRNSINAQFASYVAYSIPNCTVKVVDLNDFELPIYTTHYEEENGIPENVSAFDQLIQEADSLVISLAEHNGSYTAAFKNLFDWLTRLRPKCFEGKNVLLTSTAPGPRGGLGVLQAAEERFPRHGGTLLGSFSLPHFHDNFDTEKGIVQADLKSNFDQWIKGVIEKIN